MKKGLLISLLVVAAIVVIVIASAAGGYNRLVTGRENVRLAEGNIQTQLQRRSDLIPNLVETVKGYAAHEEDILNNLADARAKMAGARTTEDLAQGDAELTSALSRLLVVVENYPDLKADANFRQLMDELAGTENRVATARRDYNDAARVYNRNVQSFPTVLYARLLGFEPVPYFEARADAQDAPEVSFGD